MAAENLSQGDHLKSRPLVSVITPVYNSARFIGQTIESVQSQSSADWEMVIVDDCSTDNTVEIIEGYAAGDPRIITFENTRNQGPAATRNRALGRAKGRFIAFLDGDDQWLPTKLERQLSRMTDNNLSFTCTQYRRMSHDGARIGRLIAVPEKINYRDLLKNTTVVTSTVVVDREKTGSFQMVDTYYDDYVLWLGLLKRGITAIGVQQDLVRYRIGGKSVSSNKLNSALWVWRTLRSIEKLERPYAAWCFIQYAYHAVVKYSRF